MNHFKVGDKVRRNPSSFPNSIRLNEIGVITDIKANGAIEVLWGVRVTSEYKLEQLLLEESKNDRTPGTVVTTPDIGARVSLNPEKGTSYLAGVDICGTIVKSPFDGVVNVKWDNGSEFSYKLDSLIYAEQTKIEKKNNMEKGTKVVRNPDTWVYRDQDHHNGKPSVGIITSCDDTCGWVRWESGRTCLYILDNDLLYYNQEQSNMKTGVVTSFEKGLKVVRNPDTWNYGTQDFFDGKRSVGVILKKRYENDEHQVWVRWESGKEFVYLLGNLLYYNQEQSNMKTEVLAVFEKGTKVVRNPDNWIYGDQDHYKGKPSIGVINTTHDDERAWVRWESGTELLHRLDNLLKMVVLSDIKPSECKSEIKLNGNNVTVPNILPTIKYGKIPSSSTLIPKIKKAIIIKSNLQFREVVV